MFWDMTTLKWLQFSKSTFIVVGWYVASGEQRLVNALGERVFKHHVWMPHRLPIKSTLNSKRSQNDSLNKIIFFTSLDYIPQRREFENWEEKTIPNSLTPGRAVFSVKVSCLKKNKTERRGTLTTSNYITIYCTT